MKTLNPYLNFSGKCKEALEFYKEALNGEIASLQTFENTSIPMPEEQKQRVMHAEFKADGIFFMASDGMPGMPLKSGNQVNMSINLDDLNEAAVIFGNLSKGGKTIMPFEDTFWGARFGLLMDKYGVMWMVNCNKE